MRYKMVLYYESTLDPSREYEFMTAFENFLNAQQDTKFEGAYIQPVNIGQRIVANELANSVLKNNGEAGESKLAHTVQHLIDEKKRNQNETE